MTTVTASPDVLSRAATHRRALIVLPLAQVFSSLGNGSTLALGSVLAVELSGDEAWAGASTTALGLGAALSAVPLSRIAVSHGRRVALGTGLVTAIWGTVAMVLAVVWSSFPLLVVGSLLVGVATAVNLQARFAATDLSEPRHRGRDLSMVVWAVTIGAVIGPNLVGPGTHLAAVLGLPPYAGAFLISAAGMALGGTIIVLGLTPDPLLMRRALDDAPAPTRGSGSWAAGARIVASHPKSLAAVIAMAGAHVTMVAVMSMTPLHLSHHMGSSPDTLTVIGITISLHIAGMYALSPLMGVATDRWGARAMTAAGLVCTLLSVAIAGVGAARVPMVTIGLVLLGLGWSAATVAGATMLTAALPPAERVEAQGFTDAVTSLVGALGAASAGIVMGLSDFPGVGAAAATLSLAALAMMLHLTRAGATVRHG